MRAAFLNESRAKNHSGSRGQNTKKKRKCWKKQDTIDFVLDSFPQLSWRDALCRVLCLMFLSPRIATAIIPPTEQ